MFVFQLFSCLPGFQIPAYASKVSGPTRHSVPIIGLSLKLNASYGMEIAIKISSLLGFPTISVEGAQSTMQFLATSVKLNNFTAISKLIQKAVSNESGCSHMSDHGPGNKEVVVDPCEASGKLDPGKLTMVTLDDIAREFLSDKHLQVRLCSE